MRVSCGCLYIFLWCIFVLFVLGKSSEREKDSEKTVKKELSNSSPVVDHPPQLQQPEHVQEANDGSKNKTDNLPTIHDVVGRRSEDFEIPNSFRIGFYIFIGLGLLAIFFIVFRSYKLRLSRAERRYGVQGDRSAQELTPLPIAIEDDSDNEDQTLFEINRQTRVS